jgi:hypothetical protein
MKRVLLALAVGVLLLGACGDDDDGGALGGGGDLSSEEQAVVDDIKAEMLEDDESGFSLTDEEADCTAIGMLRAVGVDRAQELNDAPEGEDDLTVEEAEKVADAMVSCVDLRPLMVSGMTEGGEISEESAGCLAEAITDDDMKALLVAEFSGEETEVLTDVTRKITSAMADCLTDEEFAEMVG